MNNSLNSNLKNSQTLINGSWKLELQNRSKMSSKTKKNTNERSVDGINGLISKKVNCAGNLTANTTNDANIAQNALNTVSNTKFVTNSKTFIPNSSKIHSFNSFIHTIHPKFIHSESKPTQFFFQNQMGVAEPSQFFPEIGAFQNSSGSVFHPVLQTPKNSNFENFQNWTKQFSKNCKRSNNPLLISSKTKILNNKKVIQKEYFQTTQRKRKNFEDPKNNFQNFKQFRSIQNLNKNQNQKEIIVLENVKTTKQKNQSSIVLNFESKSTNERIKISNNELFDLTNNNYISDSIVDFSIFNYFDQSSKRTQQHFQIFNSHYYNSVLRNINNKKILERMCKKIQWNKTCFIFPICQQLHWTVVVVTYPLDQVLCRIIHFNSMANSKNEQIIINNIILFFQKIIEIKKKNSNKNLYYLKKSYRLAVVPKQNNLIDCALYSIEYIKKILDNPIVNMEILFDNYLFNTEWKNNWKMQTTRKSVKEEIFCKMLQTDNHNIPIGLINNGSTCYMNSILQIVGRIPCLAKFVPELPTKKEENCQTNDLITIQYLKEILQALQSDRKEFNPINFCRSFKWLNGRSVRLGMQQDAHEFLLLLLNKIFRCSKDILEPINLKTTDHKICSNAHLNSKEKIEQIISLEVQDLENIFQSLDKFVELQEMVLENKYFCRHCQQLQPSTKTEIISELPDTLMIQLKRFRYNSRVGQSEKICTRFNFSENLDMHPWCSEQLRKQQKNNEYYQYSLIGCVTHIGSTVNSGHYISYIKHKTNDKQWFCVNDKHVSECTFENVIQQSIGGEHNGSAYILVYQRNENYKNFQSELPKPRVSSHEIEIELPVSCVIKSTHEPKRINGSKKSISKKRKIKEIQKIDSNLIQEIQLTEGMNGRHWDFKKTHNRITRNQFKQKIPTKSQILPTVDSTQKIINQQNGIIQEKINKGGWIELTAQPKYQQKEVDQKDQRQTEIKPNIGFLERKLVHEKTLKEIPFEELSNHKEQKKKNKIKLTISEQAEKEKELIEKQKNRLQDIWSKKSIRNVFSMKSSQSSSSQNVLSVDKKEISFCKMISSEGKYRMAKHLNTLLGNKKLFKLEYQRWNINYRTAIRWSTNPERYNPENQKKLRRRSKLTESQEQELLPLLYKPAKEIIKYVNDNFGKILSSPTITELKKKFKVSKNDLIEFETLTECAIGDYTAEQKWKISLEAKIIGVTTIARKYNVPRSTLYGWCKKDMRPQLQLQRSQKRGRQAKMSPEDLEKMGEWIDESNSVENLVDTVAIQGYVKILTGWKPSQTWVSRSLHRLGFSSRKALTKMGVQLGEEFELKLQDFRENLVDLLKDQILAYPDLNIWVMDEKGIWNFSPNLRTYTRKRKPKPYVRGLATNNGRDTIAACCNFRGEKLPICAIRHRNRKTKKKKLENGDQIIQQIFEGCKGINNELMKIWADLFIKQAQKGDILLMDNLLSHKNKEVLKIIEDAGINVLFLVKYGASHLSPLDNSIFSVLGRKLRRTGRIFHSFEEKMDTVQKL